MIIPIYSAKFLWMIAMGVLFIVSLGRCLVSKPHHHKKYWSMMDEESDLHEDYLVTNNIGVDV